MKNFTLAFALLFALPLFAETVDSASHLPPQNTFWYAVEASDEELCGGSDFVASIPSGNVERPHILIVKLVTDFPNIPPSPYVVRVYRNLEASLEDIVVKRWREDLVGFASGVDGEVMVVTKARRSAF